MRLRKEERSAKLKVLVEIEGFRSLEDMLSASFGDSVCPGICAKPDCDYSVEVERDQRRGYCEACGEGTVQSALVLAELI